MLIMIPALPDFHARYPDIQIDLGVTDRPVDLIGENVDCVVRAGEITDQSLIARRIAELSLRDLRLAVISRAATANRGTRPSSSNNHFVVGYFSASSGRPFPLALSRGGEHDEINGRYIVAVNDGNAYVAAGLAGLGVMQAPTVHGAASISPPALCGRC